MRKRPCVVQKYVGISQVEKKKEKQLLKRFLKICFLTKNKILKNSHIPMDVYKGGKNNKAKFKW